MRVGSVSSGMAKFVIVASTPLSQDGFHRDRPLGRSLALLRKGFDCFGVELAFENSEGLSRVYNRAIEKHRSLKTDYLIFVHDDAFLNDLFLFEKLEKGFRAFDLIGIAGATYLNLDSENVGWFHCPPHCRAGGVLHPVVDRKEGQFCHESFGAAPKRCLVVDGVFMALKMAALGEIRFDEQFTFDFYDLDFCLAMHKAGRAIGVAPILITHLSQGASLGGRRFKLLERRFIEKHRRTNIPAGEPWRDAFSQYFVPQQRPSAKPTNGEYRLAD